MADSTFRGFEVGEAQVDIFNHHQGLSHVASMMRRGYLQVGSYHTIFVFIGRANLHVGQEEFPDAAVDILDTIRRFNPHATIFISGPIPYHLDNMRQVAASIWAARTIRKACASLFRVQFARIAQLFYDKQGIKHCMYRHGVLSEQARKLLVNAIKTKLQTARPAMLKHISNK